jgi:hypothetical protein
MRSSSPRAGEQFPGDEWTVLTDRPDLFAPVVETIEVPLGSPWAQPLWDHLGRRACSQAPADSTRITQRRACCARMLRVPGVVTVHDLSVRAMPQTFRPRPAHPPAHRDAVDAAAARAP